MYNWLKKKIRRFSPIALSKNHRYDRLVDRILKRQLSASSNCIDIGSHQGDFLASFVKFAPEGRHFGFEPIPYLYDGLLQRFKDLKKVSLYDCALSNEKGVMRFNHVITNPAYSGLLKRDYDRAGEKDEIITVAVNKLDDIIPEDIKIDFIKIDVEGGEYGVLLGSKKTIQNSHPLIVFEFGMGASDIYQVTPEMIFHFFESHLYKIALLENYLKQKASLAFDAFNEQYVSKKNYYFIAFSVI